MITQRRRDLARVRALLAEFDHRDMLARLANGEAIRVGSTMLAQYLVAAASFPVAAERLARGSWILRRDAAAGEREAIDYAHAAETLARTGEVETPTLEDALTLKDSVLFPVTVHGDGCGPWKVTRDERRVWRR